MLYAEVIVGGKGDERKVIVGPFPHDDKKALKVELEERGERAERLLTQDEYDKARSEA